MASYDSSDGIDQSSQHHSRQSWLDLSPEERQLKINRSRNYLRYNMSRNFHLDLHNPNLTLEEKFIVEQYNDHLQALKNLKVTFFTHFYDNCPKVGSTLKRKDKPKKATTEDLPW